jgi:sulfoxide reductase heme-binding subunit YedZ
MPLIGLVVYSMLGTPRPGNFFYWTGAISAILMIVTLAITPLTRVWGRIPGRNWLIKQRRYLGVASFLYAAVHTLYWVQAAGIQRVVQKSVGDFSIIIAWISLAILAALFLTSNDTSVRKLGPNWKRLQRWAYVAIPLGILHWFLEVSFDAQTLIIYGGAYAAVSVGRLISTRWRRNRAEV